jgi:hypothetical protein
MKIVDTLADDPLSLLFKAAPLRDGLGGRLVILWLKEKSSQAT